MASNQTVTCEERTTSDTGAELVECYLIRTSRGSALESLLRFYDFPFVRTRIGADRLAAYEEDAQS